MPPVHYTGVAGEEWVSRRMRAHICLCILGYFLRQLLKSRMDRGGVGMPVREALMRLRRAR